MARKCGADLALQSDCSDQGGNVAIAHALDILLQWPNSMPRQKANSRLRPYQPTDEDAEQPEANTEPNHPEGE
jgi:hypothetical protein